MDDFIAGVNSEFSIDGFHYVYKSLISGSGDSEPRPPQCGEKAAGSMDMIIDLGLAFGSNSLPVHGTGSVIAPDKMKWAVDDAMDRVLVINLSGDVYNYRVRRVWGTLTAKISAADPVVSGACGRIYNVALEDVDGDAGNILHMSGSVTFVIPWPTTVDITQIQYRGYGGINTLPAETPVRPAKMLADDARATLTGKVAVSASNQLLSRVYISDTDGSDAIAITGSSIPSVSVGDKLDVTGTLDLTDGERVLTSPSVIVHTGPFSAPGPFAVPNSWVGAGAIGSYTPAIGTHGGVGNTGSVVRICGRVTQVNVAPAWFYIDDGAKLIDGSGSIGLRIRCDELAGGNTISLPPAGSYVSVTGMSSAQELQGGVVPAVRPRTQADIRVLALPGTF